MTTPTTLTTNAARVLRALAARGGCEVGVLERDVRDLSRERIVYALHALLQLGYASRLGMGWYVTAAGKTWLREVGHG